MTRAVPGMNPKAVQFIGVGNMGGAMAANLLAKGWQVFAHDVDASRLPFLEKKGAVAGVYTLQNAIKSIAIDGSPAATVVAVVDAAQVHDALFGPQGIAPHLPAGHTVLLCSTIAPADVEQTAARLAQQGVHCVDAPMSGGPARALAGRMSLMVACPDAVFAKQAALLHAMADPVIRISTRVGDGARTKLVNNLLATINLVGAAEAMALAQRLGLDAHTTLNVIEQSSGQSWIGSERMRRALAGDLAPRAHIGLLQKDSALALRAASEVGWAGPLGPAAAQVFAQAAAAGLAAHDDAALLGWLQHTNAK